MPSTPAQITSPQAPSAQEQAVSRPSFQIEKVAHDRAKVVRSLSEMPRGHGFCVVTTCDISRFGDFEKRCRQARRRPPSFYAYVARCMGATLQNQRHLIAARYGKKRVVPSQVQIKIAVEAATHTGEKMPMMLMFHDLGNRTMPDIADEMKARLKPLKRTPPAPHREASRFAPPGSPLWWSVFVQNVRARHPRMRHAKACTWACAQLSSTSQLTKGHAGWGIQMFTPSALSVTLGGISKRALVVDDEIVARLCVDMAVTFDHDITDGAPATRYLTQLVEEIESGRLLCEHAQKHDIEYSIATAASLGTDLDEAV